LTAHKTPTGYVAKHPVTGRFIGHHATLGAAVEQAWPTPPPAVAQKPAPKPPPAKK
jgi:hypothetical protein